MIVRVLLDIDEWDEEAAKEGSLDDEEGGGRTLTTVTVPNELVEIIGVGALPDSIETSGTEPTTALDDAGANGG